jgi:uncharacterized protein YbbC (DUF1343 family)/CubicO group peptidase (beta-lactamase class C family)
MQLKIHSHLLLAYLLLTIPVPAWGIPPCPALPLVEPLAVGLHADQLDFIEPLIGPEIEAGQFPGCVVLVGRYDPTKNVGAIAYLRAFGHRQLEPTVEPMTVDTLFDLASITKPVATATSIMILVERGIVKLRDPVSRHIPEFAQQGKETVTIEQLLTHQGGLLPDNALADYQDGPAKAWERIWALGLRQPPGEKFVYTDVGYLVLGDLVRRKTGQDLNQFTRENIYHPLGMRATGYLPDEKLRARAAPTEKRDGQWLRGEVHDPRSALLGGVAGHAGLFSTAADLAQYATAMLRGASGANMHPLSQRGVIEMIRPRTIGDHRRGLGWDVQSKYSSNRGDLFSARAFGHGGFTGTALWMDPELNLFVVFLANRLHPDGHGSVNHLVGRIGSIAAAAIQSDGTNHSPQEHSPQDSRGNNHFGEGRQRLAAQRTEPAVLTGIDVLVRDQFAQVAGRRVGLITNHTGLDRHGMRTADLLQQAANVQLVALFSPEHGMQGKLDQAHIQDARDEPTGLPIYSLYGNSRQPVADQLAGIDTFVFDIQDIGTRFYTYISTMGMAMEVATQNGLRFVVLDRPNPIGGVEVAGPMLEEGQESFVGYHRLPVRHGMTAGELARMFRAEKNLDLELQTVSLTGWRRADYWDATGITWVNPSPNMRSLTQALLYPGIGLLETTNLSVGRGTDTPFEVVGAPWIDGQRLARKLAELGLPGVTFVPIRFTPDASKFANESCGGINVVITARRHFQSVRTGLQIACTLRHLYPDQWQTDRYNRLLANSAAYQTIGAGCDPQTAHRLTQLGLEDFLLRREKYLLYPEK